MPERTRTKSRILPSLSLKLGIRIYKRYFSSSFSDYVQSFESRVLGNCVRDAVTKNEQRKCSTLLWNNYPASITFRVTNERGKSARLFFACTMNDSAPDRLLCTRGKNASFFVGPTFGVVASLGQGRNLQFWKILICNGWNDANWNFYADGRVSNRVEQSR